MSPSAFGKKWGTGRNAKLGFEEAQKLSLKGWEAEETFEVI